VTSDDLISTIRNDYNRLAEEYARHIADELQYKPLDRELLNRFVEELKGRGEICDMGCGPGHVARYLHARGAAVFGVDLSPGMVEQAKKLNPNIRFREGNMLALEMSDASLAGITAFYAIVNLPKECLVDVFREMERVLQPGGLLLLAFHVGDETLHEDEVWGQKISMSFLLFPAAEVRSRLEQAGLVVEEVIERDPYPDVEYQSRRAYIFARKPVSR
jgi:SAM-dependent methyltransferase